MCLSHGEEINGKCCFRSMLLESSVMEGDCIVFQRRIWYNKVEKDLEDILNVPNLEEIQWQLKTMQI